MKIENEKTAIRYSYEKKTIARTICLTRLIQPTLRERRPIMADTRDPDSSRKKHTAYQNGSNVHPCGAAAHPPH